MKHTISIIVLLFALLPVAAVSQEHVNLKSGFAAGGYDVVAYFNDSAIKGDKKHVAEHDGIKYKFASQANKETFLSNPEMYVPQYGGYCAYAVAVKGEKVGVNPKTYQIKDNKLYLFYNSWGVNTLDKWNEEGASQLQQKADANWETIVN